MVVRRTEWGRFRIVTHLLVWGLPIIQAAIPLIADKYKTRFFWCWISEDNNGVWEFSLLYAQMGLVSIAAGGLWLTVVFRMCHVRLN